MKKEPHRNQQKGFTLVETMMVMAIFPLVALSLFTVIQTANVLFHTNQVYASINQDHMQTLRHLTREVGESSPLTTPSHLSLSTDVDGNSVLTFQIPIDWDNDGDVVSGSLNPSTEWGAYMDVAALADGVLNGWVRYLVTNNQLIRQVLDSSQNEIAGSGRVIANDVQSFIVSKQSATLEIAVNVQKTDEIGQMGQARQLGQKTFNSSVSLRNAVN